MDILKDVKMTEGDERKTIHFGFLRFLRSYVNFQGLYLQERKFDYIRRKYQKIPFFRFNDFFQLLVKE